MKEGAERHLVGGCYFDTGVLESTAGFLCATCRNRDRWARIAEPIKNQSSCAINIPFPRVDLSVVIKGTFKECCNEIS